MSAVRVALATLALSLCQCGPVLYSVAIGDAAQTLEEARQAGADRDAPYEFHYAQEHLQKAREFAGEAEYQNALDMASVAEENARTARDIARRRQRESGR
jgi:hypothetical protein